MFNYKREHISTLTLVYVQVEYVPSESSQEQGIEKVLLLDVPDQMGYLTWRHLVRVETSRDAKVFSDAEG